MLYLRCLVLERLVSCFWKLVQSCHIGLLAAGLFLTLKYEHVFLHRYQYYLQLKKDVLDGRISCSLEQAIRLASLAVQGNASVQNQPCNSNLSMTSLLFPGLVLFVVTIAALSPRQSNDWCNYSAVVHKL